MRVLRVSVGLLCSMITMCLVYVHADFEDILESVQPDCTGIADGTIVIENEENKGTYWYAMCYGEEMLENLGGTIWYEAGKDLMRCIKEGDYGFDVPHDDVIQLLPNCESYGDTLYEYVGDTPDITATTQSFNGDGAPLADVQPREREVVGSSTNTTTGSSGYRKYAVFGLLVLLFGFGVYQVSKK